MRSQIITVITLMVVVLAMAVAPAFAQGTRGLTPALLLVLRRIYGSAKSNELLGQEGGSGCYAPALFHALFAGVRGETVLNPQKGFHYEIPRGACANGRKGTVSGASRYQKTRDPARTATFQRLSL